ncbi:hypothetical protein FACS1894167_01000 [Synergistales bacterium]|nr:hypothetical protein FACS1894167_01000 [Synergistales bacterium]
MRYIEHLRKTLPTMKKHLLMDLGNSGWLNLLPSLKTNRLVYRVGLHTMGFVMFLLRLPKYIVYLNPEKLILPGFEVCVTTRCTLKCVDCTQRNTFYRSGKYAAVPEDSKLENISASIGKVLAAIDGVVIMRIMGGEVLLWPPLPQLLDEILASDKVFVLDVVTNGTLIPSGELLKRLKNKKAKVSISDYGVISSKKDALIELFRENGVRFDVAFDDGKAGWRRIYKAKDGPELPRGRTDEELGKIFKLCPSAKFCKHVIDDRLYICAILAHMNKLKIKPFDGTDFVDLNLPAAQVRDGIENFQSLDYLPACDYCDYMTGEDIQPAIQEEEGGA